MQSAGTLICPAETPESIQYFTWEVWTERLLVILLLLLFVVRGFIPAWGHLDSDFTNYYLAARLYHEGYPVERVYDWTWFQRQKDHAGLDRPLVGFIPSTLPSALTVLPLSSLPPLQANRCWLIISLGFLLSAVVLLKRITGLTWRRIAVLTFLAVAPLHSNFLLGQVHLVILFLLALAAWLYFREWHFMSGVALASAAALKIYPVLFLFFFLLKKRWRAAAGLAFGMAIAAMLSVRLFGAAACGIYLREVLLSGLRGEIIDPYAIEWDSLNTILRRLFIFEPELNPAPVAHLPSLFAFLHPLIHAFIFVAFLWAISSPSADPSREKLEWGSYCFLLLLLSSEPLPYHFVALILTAALVVDYLAARRRSAWAGVIVALYTLACLPYDRLYRLSSGGWKSLLFFPRLSCLVLLAAVLLWILISSSSESFENRLSTRSSLFAAVGFVALTASGFVFNVHHLAGQFDNYKTRLITSLGSAIAIDPVVASDRLLFGALAPQFSASTRDAYAVRELHNGLLTSFGGDGDWFHPAVMNDGHTSWAEVATESSRIVRFDDSRPLSGSQPLAVEASDAEQPVVSQSGKLLAYIREVRGRGSVWLRRIERGEGATQSSAERELAGTDYDVREAAFSPDDQLVFSSWQHGRYELYSADPQTGTVAPLTAVTCSARYPAISPDGRWMAFSCERGGVWQLVAMNLRTLEQQPLTASDCNSITPAWMPESRDVIYATDCGRALGITALSKLNVVP